jgi:hypothetical protein
MGLIMAKYASVIDMHIVFQLVQWCHIDKKLPMVQHEIHHKNNVDQLRIVNLKKWKHTLEVHIAMTRNPIIAQNQMLLIMAQIVYAKMALKAQVN